MDIGKSLKQLGARIERRLRRREIAWHAVAQRRGGFAKNSRRRWLVIREPPTIDVIVGEVAVHVDLYVVQTGNSSMTYTRIRANYLLAMGPSFKVKRTVFGGAIGKAIGFEDIELGGNPDFDHAFFVRSAHPEATRRAWKGVNKGRLLERSDSMTTVSSDGRTVTMLLYGSVTDEATLDDAIDWVAVIASYGSEWLAPIRGVPGSVWKPPEGPWNDRSMPSAQLERRGVPVWIHPKVVELGFAATATAALTGGLPPFSFGCDENGLPLDGDTITERVLRGAIAQLLPALGRATIESDGAHVHVTPSGTLDPRRLETAATIAAECALGAPAEGAYR